MLKLNMDTESPSKNFQPYLFLYDSLDFFLSCNSGLWSRKVAVCATMERTFSSLEAFLLLSSASSGAYCTKYLAPGCGFEILELPGQPMPCHHLKERGRWSEIAAVGFLRQRRWWWCFFFQSCSDKFATSAVKKWYSSARLLSCP